MSRILPLLLICTFFYVQCGILEFKNENVTLLPILYGASDGNGESAIYTMNTDGSGQKKVFSLGLEGVRSPKRSPDGKKILFNTGLNATTRGESIYTVRADGTGLEPVHVYEQLGIPMYGYSPTWSPDGTKISFETYGFTPGWGLNNEIFVFDLELDSLIRITNHPASDANVSWSPDSKKIAFNSNRKDFETDFDTSAHHIYQVDIATLEVELISNTENGILPIWSKKGNRILFQKRIKGITDGIYIIDPETNDPGKISYLNTESSYGAVAWSKDEKEILVQEFNRGVTKLYRYNIESENKRLIIESNRVGSFDWYEPK